ncbi:MAG TPA: RNase adapter RapZ [Armatimonadota bacterium]|nr:RNase adapter RapZ [Armatimonadota bacterium]
MRFVIITGISGSGKSQALRIFEDLGYYCVDNLPPALLAQLADLGKGRYPNIACVVDVRAGKGLDALDPALEELSRREVETTILFLESSDPVLVNRFKETRRKHPLLLEAGGILPSIQRERELLTDLKDHAHKVIDTSDHTPRSLSQLLAELFGERTGPQAGLVITVLSFGFKHGLPLDADLVFDVRFLRNPHYERDLRWQDGQQNGVVEFIRQDPLTQPFVDKLCDLVDFSIPPYIQEGKAYLTIAIGCTGGRHRSVMVTEDLAGFLRSRGYEPLIQHRDVKK